MDEISRMEKILRGDPIEPITRLEKFCAKAAGTYTGDPLTPVTRLEWFLDQISGGGGGGPTLSTFIAPVPAVRANYTGQLDYSSAANAQFDAPEGVAYDKVWNSDQYISGMYFDKLSKHIVYSMNYIPSYLFNEMTGIVSICLTNTSFGTIYSNAFFKANNLVKLAIYSTSVATLANINVFANTPFASGGTGGTLYVPSSLISSYQSASTNWSTILGYANNSIRAIEGSEFQV